MQELCFQSEVLIPVNSSVLCHSILSKAPGQSTNSSTLFRGALKAYYFFPLPGWRLPSGSAYRAGTVPMGIIKTSVLESCFCALSFSQFAFLVLTVVIPDHKPLPAYSKDGFDESHDPYIKH